MQLLETGFLHGAFWTAVIFRVHGILHELGFRAPAKGFGLDIRQVYHMGITTAALKMFGGLI